MARRYVASLALAVLCLLRAGDVYAHGAPPVVMDVLKFSAEQADVVRLTRGLVHRTETGFRFVCPEALGGDVTAPMVAIPDGPVVVASDRLFFVYPDGRSSPHPNHVGRGVALAHNQHALYGLFTRDGATELRQVSETDSVMIRTLDAPFMALAASSSRLFVARWSDLRVELHTFSLHGEPIEQISWHAANQVASVELVVADEQLYVWTWGTSTPWLTLGMVSAHGYQPLREAGVSRAGPVVLHGKPFAMFDGRLESLETRAPLLSEEVSCLGEHAGALYACAQGDVLQVDSDGTRGLLFQLSTLREPDYANVSESDRLKCSTRWQDLRDDLSAWEVARAVTTDAAQDGGASDDGGSAMPTRDGAATGCNVSGADTELGWLSGVLIALVGLRRRTRVACRRF